MKINSPRNGEHEHVRAAANTRPTQRRDLIVFMALVAAVILTPDDIGTIERALHLGLLLLTVVERCQAGWRCAGATAEVGSTH